MDFTENTPVQEISLKEIAKFSVKLMVKRDDLLHPQISGNKWRKLKYNLRKVQRDQIPLILTFGGPFSNHISATAAAGKQFGIKTVGVIRGDEIRELNHTLQFAESCGMHLHFVSRLEYRRKTEQGFLDGLKKKYGTFYLLPEGGSNELAVEGCKEILSENTLVADVICCAVGTGGTMAGLALSKRPDQRLIGFPALKNASFLEREVKDLMVINEPSNQTSFELDLDHHFGGYGKITEELVQFSRRFYEEAKIKLDLIYTAKMVFGIVERIKMGQFNNQTVLFVHTGGLQGNRGMIERYKLGELY